MSEKQNQPQQDRAEQGQYQSVQMIAIGDEDAGQRVDNYLLKVLKGVPRSRIYKMLRSGEVRINKGRVKASQKLNSGDVLRVPPVRLSAAKASAPNWLCQLMDEHICFENEDFLAINKPTGIAVHAGTGVDYGVIEALVQSRGDKQLNLVHRIDRDTSGLLLVAKHRQALNAAVAAFKARKVQKHYRALIGGALLQPQTVDLALRRDQPQGGERMVVVDANGADAHSVFTPIQQFEDCTLVDVQITTGRTHQIRVHSASMGMAVIGDGKYGDRARNKAFKARGFGHMFLHSAQLLLNPVGYAPLDLEAPVPDQWRNYV